MISIRVYGNGLPLVLLHGWGFDADIWLPLIPALTKRYRLYCVDLPGFGTTPYGPWEAFQDALLRAIPGNFALLGWSLGGLYATRLAIDNPTRVTHLMNITASPCMLQKPHWPGIEERVLRQFYRGLTTDCEQTLHAFLQLQLRGRIGLDVRLGKASMAGLKAGLDVLLNWDLRNELLQFEKPVLYVFGRLDAIVPYRLMAKMQACFPTYRYVAFDKAAHLPFLSHPEAFVDVVEAFL